MRLHTDDSFSKQISLSVLTLLQKEDDKECWLNNQSDHLCKHKLLIGPRQIYTHTHCYSVSTHHLRGVENGDYQRTAPAKHTHPCRFQSVSSIIQKAVCYKSLLLHVNSWQCHKNEVQKLSSVVLFSHILHSRKKPARDTPFELDELGPAWVDQSRGHKIGTDSVSVSWQVKDHVHLQSIISRKVTPQCLCVNGKPDSRQFVAFLVSRVTAISFA